MADGLALLVMSKGSSHRLRKINKVVNFCDSCSKCAANILKEASDQFAPLHLCTLQARFFTLR